MFTGHCLGKFSAVRLFDAVLLDRDGTLVIDVPYNGDPAKVTTVPGARAALDRLRAAGIRLGVITNQSGLARGLVTAEQVTAVNARVEELLGPFDTWQVCPHADADRCGCRKPAPGLVRAAARALGTEPARCAVVGDIGTDLAAAGAAGAFGVLVPTPVTRREEIAAAPAVAGDLAQAVDLILRRNRLAAGTGTAAPPGRHVLAVRGDSAGDVLLTGPAIRAVAARAGRVTLLCGPRGAAAADLLPGLHARMVWPVPWLDPDPPPIDPDEVHGLVARITEMAPDEAIIFTSFHQSPLPFALVLRLAGVARVSAISDDYPGSLLDLRHRVPLGIPEAERALSLAAAAGYPLPAGDDPGLRVTPHPDPAIPPGYVVLHPGASVPARACPPERCAEYARAITRAGHEVVVTGAPAERDLTAYVAGDHARDLGGKTDLAELAGVLAGARCAVVANTGPAHLAAAVRTPVVSLFAPTVPFGQWGPYRVPHVRLGAADAPCRHSRAAAACPVGGHPCLSSVTADQVLAAIEVLGR